ncbi:MULTISPECIES: AAA family ATPase [unclassified Clostridium]|uniref:AAA family ATPase n=1 Tax=Clostridium TaxID=1485 RepID=UPI001C8C7E4F|nr:MULTISPECIES: AAA family ATPase [unclassified Clostridium]MBX9138214.1 AAA family ATPase [Clostridium sp. K12(2020)]MBX9144588.1 AAA family ATPase [Clostridium sp. K13]MDU2289019.1 AAA family ATPase [Clostridium celatum]
MKKELTPSEIVFKLDVKDTDVDKSTKGIKEFNDAYKKVERAINIDKEGYNLYLIDTFSKDKLKELTAFIEKKYKDLEAPRDICYVTLEDVNKPEAIFVANGKGKKLKETVDDIKNCYLEAVDDFYGDSSNDEKDYLVEDIQNKRNSYISELTKMAKEEGFEVKATSKGFAFIPLSGDEAMTEKEYDDLEDENKNVIVAKAGTLKKKAESILDELKDIEVKSIKKLKKIYSKFLATQMEDEKDNALLEFITDDDSYEYLERLFTCIEEDLINCYTMSIEDDESEIYDILNKYDVRVIVDNTNNSAPPVIFEEDPNLNNLIGLIEYENHNGMYTTNISLINAGSILKANEGCLILRLSSLAVNNLSYYYLKKILLSNMVSFDTNKSYLEFININGLKPQPIPVKFKVIIIGDYETYDILYNSDEDFKKLFPLRAEFSSIVKVNNDSVIELKNIIENKIRKNELFNLNNEAMSEMLKYLCRKSSSRNRILAEEDSIDKLLVLANNLAKEKKRLVITEEDILDVAYEEELIENEMMSMYEENKILIDINGRKIGAINALAVLDSGYCTFGKPMRITCVACKGSGRIVDIQKESNLSGKIHEKSISILRGLLTNLLNPYENIPVDFHLSFEQTYGMVEGDSASVAEIICVLSALSKKGVNQSIAVTGSINQFGDIQPIGGVNEKIEGFFKVCNMLDTVEGKGVLIPEGNKDEIILKSEVEKAIEEGKFHIYTMNNLNDAIEVLLLDKEDNIDNFYENLQIELEKYKEKSKDIKD